LLRETHTKRTASALVPRKARIVTPESDGSGGSFLIQSGHFVRVRRYCPGGLKFQEAFDNSRTHSDMLSKRL
jgi:hypothetical protein